MRLPQTINVQVGKKLQDKTKDEIMDVCVRVFERGVEAVQIGYDIIRVTFSSLEYYRKAKSEPGKHLFGLFCDILGVGPPVTLVHLFDYPYEEEDDEVVDVFGDYGEVKRIKLQTYVSNTKIYTGTRLISIVLSGNLPRYVTIGGYSCRIWYRGQPLICNLCAVQGHKSANCPNKDKCRRCCQSGHFARQCTNAWGTTGNVGEGRIVSNDRPEDPVVNHRPGGSNVDLRPEGSNVNDNRPVGSTNVPHPSVGDPNGGQNVSGNVNVPNHSNNSSELVVSKSNGNDVELTG